ncbi:dihydroneopterin aldolase [Companilactobacillus versmoldensis]|uniref:7,8-dihydroneopterin aldolase n=1 Tax=Companilactobacillus versmoldensis DSM 14857 = KCTC 3814 TaxID=1423815 RepID=A0A0R1SKA2_9LACO|nr:dihydroneopterin aldolase [Companilactobacillus versmoldensis]KRL66930.1 dihydroneopterin aldolase [Companilactobacillus versmoldensis DSM 14857 = KCTC 3814]
MLKIKLNQMKFHAHIGVYPAEREIGQDIIINVELHLKDISTSTLLEDKLENTINYGPIYKMITKIVSQTDIKLIETLATLILEQIKQSYPGQLDNIIVNIKKLNLPIDGIIDSAEVEVTAK